MSDRRSLPQTLLEQGMTPLKRIDIAMAPHTVYSAVFVSILQPWRPQLHLMKSILRIRRPVKEKTSGRQLTLTMRFLEPKAMCRSWSGLSRGLEPLVWPTGVCRNHEPKLRRCLTLAQYRKFLAHIRRHLWYEPQIWRGSNCSVWPYSCRCCSVDCLPRAGRIVLGHAIFWCTTLLTPIITMDYKDL